MSLEYTTARVESSAGIVQVQSKLVGLTLLLQEIAKGKEV